LAAEDADATERRSARVKRGPSGPARRRKPRKVVAGSLFAATAALLGSPSGPSIAQEANRKWAIDASASYYGEQDRVTDGSVNLLVTRSGGMQGAVSVHYATANGSATTPGDYQDTHGTLDFADGEVVKAVPVPLFTDAVADGQVNFTFNLSAPGGGATLGTQIQTIVTIDDVTPDMPWASLSGDITITEGNAGTKNANLTLSVTPHTNTVMVDWQTEDGSAKAGSDYTAMNVTTTFLPGELQKQISIPILGDTTPEPDEDFFVRITGFAAGIVEFGQSEVVITDDDGFVAGLRGDANNDGQVNVTDVFYLINHLFANGPAPYSTCRGDVNTSAAVDVTDVFFLINYLFAGGAAPTPPGC